MISLIDVIGWAGSAAVVSAYGLLSNNILEGKSAIYQLLNLVGGICLVINTIYYRAYPSTFVNIVWSVIAILALMQERRFLIGKGNREHTIKAYKERP